MSEDKNDVITLYYKILQTLAMHRINSVVNYLNKWKITPTLRHSWIKKTNKTKFLCCIFLCCIFSCCIFLCCIFSCFIFCFVFFVLYFLVLRFFVLYFLCYIFRVLFFCVLFFRVLFFRVVLKAFHSLQQILLLYVWQIFVQTLKRKIFPWVGQIGLIHYPVVFLCLFWNYMIVSKFNCLLLFFLIFFFLVSINDTVQLYF